MRQLTLSVVSLVVCTAVWAQDTTEAPDPPAIPTAAERAAAEEAAKQQGTPERANEEDAGVARTRQTVEGNTTVTEYSRAGHIYSLKMKQDYGPPQYLDAEPDGRMEPTNQDLYDDVNIPKWRLGNW